MPDSAPRRPALRRRVRRLLGRAARRSALYNRLRPAPPDVVAGVVEVFGRRRLEGWVALRPGVRAVRVGLYVNEVEVTASWATDPGRRAHSGPTRAFRIWMFDVWQFCSPADRISVRADGVVLPIAGTGLFYRPRAAGTGTLADLTRRLADGYVFGQKGRLQLSKSIDVDWQKSVLGLYDRVRGVVAERGYDLFAMYGTLLGAVRERAFIGHDLDFDTAYVSKSPTGPGAAEELRDLAFALIDAGFGVECFRSHLHVLDGTHGDAARIDIFHLYFGADATLQFPFGIAGTGSIPRADWRGTTEVELGIGRVLVPVNAEQMVEHVYGESWRSPKPGFAWNLDRTAKAEDGVLADPLVDEIYWANFYAHTGHGTASPFQAFVAGQPDIPRTVVDLGCGDGRDSLAFARAGYRVVGLDRSEPGVRRAGERAADLAPTAALSVHACDVGDADRLRGVLTEARAAAGDGPVLFYARFLLHAVTEEAQRTMLRTIAGLARPGDCFAAEFRTGADAEAQTVPARHYRRLQDGPAFGAALRAEYGFADVRYEAEGTGFSPYGDEDPQLYRVVARR